MKSIAVAVLTAVLVAGCATETRSFYHQNGEPARLENQATFRDNYECKRDVSSSAVAFSRSVTAPAYARQMYLECMAARGYVYR